MGRDVDGKEDDLDVLVPNAFAKVAAGFARSLRRVPNEVADGHV
jgi:hypothetical protein